MFFNSFHFAFFFAAVFVGVHSLRSIRARNVLLLIASYYFYACWDWRFLSLIVVSTLVDYYCGKRMSGKGEQGRRKWLIVSLITNLGILGFFKYYNFFVGSADALLTRLGLEMHPRLLSIILPVGISFYTFQTLSYTIDIYYHRLKEEKNLLNFALFVAFFPQLVAGPIERATHLLPQIRKPNRLTLDAFYSGMYLIGWGLFKKVVLADNAAVVVDKVFGGEQLSGLPCLIGVYAFAVQIYCDFSAYSDIARGTARCLGYDLMLNFNLPYFSKSPSEFWQRWHISLSSWLRDYLYIPLGGNRKGSARTYVNLMLTMLLGGLWHGAGWTFVAWGAYHGALLIVYRLLPGRWRAAGRRSRMLKFGSIFLFFNLTCISWLLFRADSVQHAWYMFHSILTSVSEWDSIVLSSAFIQFYMVAGIILSMQLLQYLKRDLDIVLKLSMPVRTAIYLFGILWFIVFGEYGGTAFIYFQF